MSRTSQRASRHLSGARLRPPVHPAGRRALAGRLLAVTAALAMVLTACSGASTDDEADGSEGTPAESVGPAATGDGSPVQDTWVWERVRTVDEDGTLRDVTEDLLDGLEPDADAAVDLIDGVTFTPVPGLTPRMRDTVDSFREDLDLVAGIVEAEGLRGLQIIATPEGERSVDGDDQLLLDLGHVGLAAGAPLIVDFTFGQGLPADSDSTDGATGAALLGARMANDRFTWHGVTDEDDDEVSPGLQTVFGSVPDPEGTAGVASASAAATTRTGTGAAEASYAVHNPTDAIGTRNVGNPGLSDGVPAKAKPTLDPIDKLGGCKGSPLKCVSKYFKNMRKGFKESLDKLFDDNMPPSPKPTPKPCTGICGGLWGDPHLSSFDGLKRDLQLAGEFVLATSDPVTVHTRLEPWGSSTRISVITAAAVSIGDHRITVRAQRDPIVHFDGAPVDMAEVTAGLDLDGGLAWAFGGDLYIEGPDGVLVTIRNLEHHTLDVHVDSGTSSGDWGGLLGSPNGEESDDLTARDGTVVPTSAPVDVLYRVFGESWRIADEESLFDYDQGESTATFTDRGFPSEHITIADLTPEQRRMAEVVCTMADITKTTALEACILDYAMTGDISFVTTARVNHAVYDTPTDGWYHYVEGAETVDGDAVLDADGHALVPARTSDGGAVIALDLASGDEAWTFDGDALGCVAVTGSGAIVVPYKDDDKQVWIARLDPSDGSIAAEVAADSVDDCTSTVASGDTVVMNASTDVYGYDASSDELAFTTTVEGAHTPLTVSGDGSVWMGALEDDVSRAVQISPDTGEAEVSELPVWRIGKYIAGTDRGFIVAYDDEDGDGGGLLRYTVQDGPRPTPLPQTHGTLDFSEVPGGPIVTGEQGYVAAYLGSDEVAVFDSETGEPVRIITPSSFNNNGGHLVIAGGLAVVSPFGGDDWVEAYHIGSALLVWSRSGPHEYGQYEDLKYNDVKWFGPVAPSGQVLVGSTATDGLLIALVGPGA